MSRSDPSQRPLAAWKAVAAALAVCAGITVIALPFAPRLDPANIVMAYLLGVAVIARWLGRLPAVAAAFATVLLFDYFFVQPRFSFAVADVQYLITFVVMLAVALMIGALTARLRWEAEAAARRESRTRALYDLAHDLAGAIDATRVQTLVVAYLREEFAVDSEILVSDSRGMLVGLGGAPASGDPGVPTRVLQTGDPLPYVEPGSGVPSLALPLDAPVRRRGVLVLRSRARDVVVPAGQRALLEAVAALTSTALERIHFAEVARDTEVQMEAERLRVSVLSAVSHDLRTPLTVVVGLADSLARAQASLPAELAITAAELRDQTIRLSRMVENLLDMARLRSGEVTLRKAWQPLDEVVGSSVRIVEATFPGRRVRIDLAADLPLLEYDGTLIERVLVNLLENAVKYAPQGEIVLRGQRVGESVAIVVEDRGPGLPPEGADRLFEMFRRGAREGGAPGTGMGLAICKAIVEAHGGSISAENREGGGARLSITLPVASPPAELERIVPDATS